MPKPAIHFDKVVLRRVAVPLHEPFRISNGSVSVKESVIVELHAERNVAYGEASPMPGTFYSGESPSSTWDALCNDLVPNLLRSLPAGPIEYAEELNTYGREPFARAGIEGAVWHLAALQEHTTMSQLFGLSVRPTPSGLALGLYDTIEDLLERVRKYMPMGYRRLKIKIQPGWDEEPLGRIRAEFGNIPLMVDANASYNLREHSQLLMGLDRFALIMIEQPFAKDALDEMAQLQSSIKTPLCADESADSLDYLQEIIRLSSARIINIKVQRVGGLWNAIKMHDLAREAGLELWLGTMPELGIASAQGLSIASLPGFLYPTDIEASDRWFQDDIISPPITINTSGLIEQPGGIGMGYVVNPEKLEAFTIESQTFEA